MVKWFGDKKAAWALGITGLVIRNHGLYFKPDNQYQQKDQPDSRGNRKSRWIQNYYKHYTGREWTDARNYDLCLDSSKLGMDRCVEEIRAPIMIQDSSSASSLITLA